MKRFDFPLDRVRQWRHEQAELEELNLQRFYAERARIDALRERTEKELAVEQKQIAAMAAPQAHDLVNLDSFRQFVRSQLARIAGQRQQCDASIAQQQQRVIEARRQFELLDRLRQKALADWHALRDKEEEELAAELYLAKRRREVS